MDDMVDRSSERAPQAPSRASKADLQSGLAKIKEVAGTLTNTPGVYRMIDAEGAVLYVGKARNLKARVSSYTNPNRQTNRLLRMISLTRSMEIIRTTSESEALLLEAQLIKRYRAPFNVLLRDDKSFPHILIRRDHEWPQVRKHRGSQTREGDYFGPFASAGAVNRCLDTMQKVFQLRTCSDSVFANRTRPCLLYQIKRCSAPCVDRISASDYAKSVDEARDFLAGKSKDLQKRLVDKMETAATNMAFEEAAIYRDRLRALAQISAHQNVHSDGLGDCDVVAAARDGGKCAIQVFFYRSGQNWGAHTYFPRHDADQETAVILDAFLAQFYENKPCPRTILVSDEPPSIDMLREALSLKADRAVNILKPQRGDKRKLIDQAMRNAEAELSRRLAERASQRAQLEAVADCFELESTPERIEIYDNSHIMGSHPVGAMVVAGPDGFQKNAYRKFNIKGPDVAPGDDYAMMREVLTRRFQRLLKTPDESETAPSDTSEIHPDLILIDGGKGQISAVNDVCADLGIGDDIAIFGVAKGPDRNAGREVFYRRDGSSFTLPPHHPVLYYIQRLRDEAHRFAIGSHRARRTKAISSSPLDGVPGIGPKRKKALLNHFGTARAVASAGIRDLEAVDGINAQVARTIYGHFHDDLTA
ncbi:MAG: excinuclease ABC subunit UvrC [Pseudomonadota bacterium]